MSEIVLETMSTGEKFYKYFYPGRETLTMFLNT